MTTKRTTGWATKDGKPSAAQRRMDKLAERNRQTLSAEPARTGVSDATMAIEREALDYCRKAGHSQRDKGRQACRDCAHEAVMGRLGQARAELPPLPASVTDPVARYLDELLSFGGRWSLQSLLAKVNERRPAGDPYTETACSARIRDLRKAGRHIEQGLDDGVAVYWMPDAKPVQAAPWVE